MMRIKQYYSNFPSKPSPYEGLETSKLEDSNS